MYIKDETIQALKAQGIDIRWYPEKTFEEFAKRMWQNCYDYAFNYSKDHVAGSDAVKRGTANVVFKSMDDFVSHCKSFADRSYKRDCDPYNFSTLFVEHDGGKMIVKKENVRSKEITVEYVQKLVEKSRKLYAGYYGNFTLKMQSICEKLGYSNFCVYPTTYGIGIWVFYNCHSDEQATAVENILKSAKIEYYNEFSDARWVFRFKISKKKGNLDKIYKVAV